MSESCSPKSPWRRGPAARPRALSASPGTATTATSQSPGGSPASPAPPPSQALNGNQSRISHELLARFLASPSRFFLSSHFLESSCPGISISDLGPATTWLYLPAVSLHACTAFSRQPVLFGSTGRQLRFQHWLSRDGDIYWIVFQDTKATLHIAN